MLKKINMLRKIFIFCTLILISLPVFAQRERRDNLRENSYLSPENSRETNSIGVYYRRTLEALGNKPFGNSDMSGISKQLEDERLLYEQRLLIPLNGFVDPNEYYLGPNDILEINIWGDVPFNIPAIITPEGNLIITKVGEVKLKDKSLAQAKEIITTEINKKFKATSVSVTLKSPRTFSVSVVGVMESIGPFIVSSVDRIDKAISLTMIQKLQLMGSKTNNGVVYDRLTYFNQNKNEELKFKQEEYSLRNIKVFRRNGDTAIVDLVKYFSMSDVAGNPYLRDGDIVFVPKEELEDNSIGIYGEVYKPGIFEYRKGDKISTALKIAFGSLENSDLKNVELTRLSENGSNFNTSIVNLEAILENNAEDIELLPGDRIFIRRLYRTRAKSIKNVEIKGEVLVPGKYPIIRGETKLSEIINLAGGFTEYASLAEAKIVRKSIFSEDEMQQNPDYVRLEAIRLGDVSKSDIEYFSIEEAIKRGFVVADFKKIFIDKDEKSDIILEGDEIIFVPTNTNSVYVSGQVNNPGYITITDNANYKYYIEKAGGYSESAKKKGAVIIKAGSKEWKEPSKTMIESGDIIWVPKKVYYDYLTWTEIFRDTGGTIISLGTFIVLLYQIFK